MITNKHINKIIASILFFAVVCTSSLFWIAEDISQAASDGVKKQYEKILFDKNKILDINIIVNESEWQTMLQNATAEEYIVCDVEINGEFFYNVGIRPKGNTSLSQVASDDTTDRYSFKIEFDHYISEQSCYGLDKLVLNNIISDNSYMKEFFAYDILNYMGVATPLYSFAKISVNGEKWGLYFALEAMEEAFAERNFGYDYGELYKPESTNMGGGAKGENIEKEKGIGNTVSTEQILPAKEEEIVSERSPEEKTEVNQTTEQENQENREQRTIPNFTEQDISTEILENQKEMGFSSRGMESSGGTDLVYTDDDIDSYQAIFDSSVFDTKESDYQRVIEALKHLNTGEDLETYVDLEQTLKYFAGNTFLVNYDSYTGNLKHNYYLYEKDGRLTMLPWDFNLAFAGFQSGNASSAVNDPIDTPVSGTTLEDRPMLGTLLAVEEYQQLYHQYLQELLDGYFNSGLFDVTMEQVKQLISEEVKNDPTSFVTYEEYIQAVETLTEFIQLRVKSVQGQLDGIIPSTSEGQKADTTNLIDTGDLVIHTMGSQGGGNQNGRERKKEMWNQNSVSGSAVETEAFQTGLETDRKTVSQQDSESVSQAAIQGQIGMGERPQTMFRSTSKEENMVDNSSLWITGGSFLAMAAGIMFVKTCKRKKIQI